MPDRLPFSSRLLEPVPWSVFAWAVAIVSALILALFGLVNGVNAKVELNSAKQQEILVELSGIRSDIKNLEYLIKTRN